MNKKIPDEKITFLCRGFLLYLLLLLPGCSDGVEDGDPAAGRASGKGGEWGIVALPDVSNQPISLRVASVVNPRFKKLTNEQIRQILRRSQRLVKQYFNIDIVFTKVDELSIKDVFSRLPAAVKNERRMEIIDIDRIDKTAREKMQEALFRTLKNYQGNRQNVLDFAQPFLLQPDNIEKDFIGLSYALVDTLIARLQYWKKQTAADGKPVLDSNDYHQWVWWDSLGYGELPYDIVITNQLVASAERYGMDVHSSIRGGITAGTTTYNKHTQFSSYVYVMVYPMLNDTELLTTLRQDEHYAEQQLIDYTAALLTHELGHLLLHLGHPFGNKHCIMSPTMMLNYRGWYDALDAGQCPPGSSKGMTPGAAEIEYNRSW